MKILTIKIATNRCKNINFGTFYEASILQLPL